MFKATAFISGEAISSGLEEKELYSVLDGECIGSIPLLDREHQKKIFESAYEGFRKWSQVDYETREKYIFLFGSKLKEHSKQLTQLIQLESGKSEKEAADEVQRSIDYVTESTHAFHQLMQKPREFNSEKYPLIPETLQAMYFRVPIGVVLSITPFNYPLNTVITKIVPAILMGNSVIQKSSTNGSLTGWLVAKIFNDLSLDGYLITPGALNYYTGPGADLEKFLQLERVHVDALSYTGSRENGLSISRALPGVPQSLELSALNVALLLEDCELESTCKELLKGGFAYAGQRCTSLQLGCAPIQLKDQFLEALRKELNDYPYESIPLISKKSVLWIKQAYEDAISKGATLLTTPIRWEELKDTRVGPIVFYDLSWDMLLAQEEMFGPILGILFYKDLEEVISQINDLGYGLQASLFSKDLKRAGEIALQIDVGRVNVNLAPSRSPDFLPFPSSRKSGNSEQGIVNSLYFFSKFRGVVYKSELVEGEVLDELNVDEITEGSSASEETE
ncbi:NADP-dependent glyceraldehyde-3-phosphate dehydrogenase [Candidatus Mycoplasma haematolamae str. Purdue]|uniref:NADP-dependent glyceraldehyde-3-phosphate dehydrogenase n=1 Tax=Mycoplasma haematolamae (strain Purdue) TaxID=1212765 RepID=I7C536_MYCHA|nr:aldehyde dehydrogenase family protein [Candidatus Mycoplasma haematolamae]AFO51602.1 NADP-dependent glyceraldehyde-3-phosphate dehydrogenase [Candidatus Mycoplasma haematolamae str. Purdue]